MTDLFSEDDVVAHVTRLTRTELVRFIDAEFVRPECGASGYMFRQMDLARLELLCDLSQDLELDETALGIVVSLLDQLHTARRDLLAMGRAVDALPPDIRGRIASALQAR